MVDWLPKAVVVVPERAAPSLPAVHSIDVGRRAPERVTMNRSSETTKRFQIKFESCHPGGGWLCNVSGFRVGFGLGWTQRRNFCHRTSEPLIEIATISGSFLI